MRTDTRPNLRKIRRHAAVVGAVCVGALGLAACGEDEGSSGSGDEDVLTVYSGRSEELIAPILDRFSEETGVELGRFPVADLELAATILEEGENSPADLFFSQDAGSLDALEEAGLFAEIPKSALERVAPEYRSPDGNWVGTSGRVRIVAYNSDVLSEDDLPQSILDFTDPEWEGRVGWSPTNASFQANLTAMRAVEGEEATREWLEGMVENGAVAYADNETARDAVEAGEVDVALINHYYIEQAKDEEGEDYPVAAYHPPNGDIGSLINVAGVGRLASSEHLDETEELVGFLLDTEAQEFFTETTKEYPLIDGVEPDPDLTPLKEIEQPKVKLSELGDLQGTLELLEETGAL
jgi:iron(III) transport system substrate-binding protein